MTPQHHPQAARALRDIGTQAVLNFEGDDWRDCAIRFCLEFFIQQERQMHAASDGSLFEEAKRYAYDRGIEPPRSENAWGAVCLTMSRRGLIVKTGRYANSSGVRSHHRANPLWRLA